MDPLTLADMADWTAAGMFWATVGLVAVTLVATIFNYRLFRSQINKGFANENRKFKPYLCKIAKVH